MTFVLVVVLALGMPGRGEVGVAHVGAVSTTKLETEVRLVRSPGGAAARGVSPTEVVVTWVPAAPVEVKPDDFTIVTRSKRFEPSSLVVPVGSSIAFPNRDAILHNVFSVSAGNRFDLGLLGKGPGETTRLEQTGLVRIFCNVHREMYAQVLVVDTPYQASPSASGRVQLTDLPAGRGRLTVWHPNAEPVELDLTSPGAVASSVEVVVKRRQVPAHFNKFGKPYSRRSRGRYTGN